jgi:tagatose 1,6-diphosphate aldolase
MLGLGLTPGKLRGLQRISNANGTLTMVATDQNSSMIGMIKDSLKKKGEEREPTFDEIVEAKITLARSLAPHCSGLLVDGYYGYWNSVASFSIPPTTGVLVRVEKSGGQKNKRGAPLAAVEPGWGVSTSSHSCKCSTTNAAGTTSCCSSNRSPSRSMGKRRTARALRSEKPRR